MLDGHDQLLKTPEGQVFEGFYEQLIRADELDQMKAQLRIILDNPAAADALNRRQISELRWLVPGLGRESERVIQARARGERDVRGFIKAGLMNEHHRVGAPLNDILEVATELDWSFQALRRMPGPLPPVAVATPWLPLIQRLRFKEESAGEENELDLSESEGRLDDLPKNFWQAFNGLDRLTFFEDTLALLRRSEKGMALLELAEACRPPMTLRRLLTGWAWRARPTCLSMWSGK